MSTANTKSSTSTIINLKKIVHTLLEGKSIILGFTAFLTMASVVYALTLPHIYQTRTTFISPSSEVLLNFMPFLITENQNQTSIIPSHQLIYSKFLDKLMSYKNQKEVLLNSKYDFSGSLLSNKDNEKNYDIIIDKFLKNISLKQLPLERSSLREAPFELSITGKNPALISKYLNTLINDTSRNIYRVHFQSIINDIDIKIYEIDERKKILLYEIDERKKILLYENDERKKILLEEKEIKLSDLNDVLEIAKTVNIKDHNFNSSSLIERSDVNLVIEPNLQIPRWYSHGSIVLKKEIENLESKEININIIQNKNFEIQTLKLESMKNFEIQTLKLKSMKKLALERQNDSELIQLTQVSFEPSQPIKPNKKFILLQGLLIGLFSSIIFLTIRKLYQFGEN